MVAYQSVITGFIYTRPEPEWEEVVIASKGGIETRRLHFVRV
jgi:hypothetical protein